MSFLSRIFSNKKAWSDAPANTNGLTKFIVANDLHIGSKYQDNDMALGELGKLKNDGLTILNGDLFDRACAKKDDLLWLDLIFQRYVRTFGDNYVMGNHERNGVETYPLIKKTNAGLVVGFTHGDLLSNFDKWLMYRMKPPGASWFGLLITSLFDNLDHIKAMRPLPEKFLHNAVKYCQTYSLDYLVLGHFHPESERRYYIDGKVIIVLPAHKINDVYI